MKIYLDDERPTPPGWTRTHTAPETILALETGNVTDLSLDHDLGPNAGDGYDVILWIEEAVALRGFIPPCLTIHTANPAAHRRMTAGVKAIARLRSCVEMAARLHQ